MDEKFDISRAINTAMHNQCNILFDQMILLAEMRKKKQEDGYKDITDTVKGLKSMVCEKLDYLTENITVQDLGFCEPDGLNKFLVEFNMSSDKVVSDSGLTNLAPSIKSEYEYNGLVLSDNKRCATIIPLKEASPGEKSSLKNYYHQNAQ